MTVLFKCTSGYTVFTAAILSELYYREDYKIIAISGQNRHLLSFYTGMKESGFFDEVVILDEVSLERTAAERQVKELLQGWRQIDRFHMFLYDAYSLFFLRLLPEKTRVIFTDEGTMTYQPLRHYEIDMELYRERPDTKELYDSVGMEWEQIDEIMLYAPEMYDNSVKVPVVKIELDRLLTRGDRFQLLEKINHLFQYETSKFDYELVYFDTYLCERSMISADFEKRYLSGLVSVLNQYRYQIKLHPNETKDFWRYRYGEQKICIASSSNTPWEVILLNYLLDPGRGKLVLLSLGSTAIYNSMILSQAMRVKLVGISLLEVIKPYALILKQMEYQLRDEAGFLEKCCAGNFYKAASIEELDCILRDVLRQESGKSQNPGSGLVGIEKGELNWLRNCYNRRMTLTGNTFALSKLTIIQEDETRCQAVGWIDYSYKETEVYFEFPEGMLQRRSFRFEWAVFEEDICDKISVSGIFRYDNRGRKIPVQYTVVNRGEEREVLQDSKKNVIKGEISVWESLERIGFLVKIEGVRKYSSLLQAAVVGQRFKDYNEVFYNWLILKQKGLSIPDYFIRRGCHDIAVYGNGRVGRLLYEELRPFGFCLYFVTDSADYIGNDKERIISLDKYRNETEKPDLMIITPVYEYEAIKAKVRLFDSETEIISIFELIQKILAKR